MQHIKQNKIENISAVCLGVGAREELGKRQKLKQKTENQKKQSETGAKGGQGRKGIVKDKGRCNTEISNEESTTHLCTKQHLPNQDNDG